MPRERIVITEIAEGRDVVALEPGTALELAAPRDRDEMVETQKLGADAVNLQYIPPRAA